MSGWPDVLRSPTEVIQFFNELGFDNYAYRAAQQPPPNFISTGSLVSITPVRDESVEGNVGAYLYGTGERELDEIRLKLNVNDPIYGQRAKNELAEIMKKFFLRFNLVGLDQFERAVDASISSSVAIADIVLSVVRQPHDTNKAAYSLIFIFHRPEYAPLPN